jgi:hypothetical protein
MRAVVSLDPVCDSTETIDVIHRSVKARGRFFTQGKILIGNESNENDKNYIENVDQHITELKAKVGSDNISAVGVNAIRGIETKIKSQGFIERMPEPDTKVIAGIVDRQLRV